MEQSRQLGFVLLIGLLLLPYVLPLGSDKQAVAPTPTPPTANTADLRYPDLPGRLIFRSEDQLQLLQGGKVRSVPLPASFTLPDDAQSAFSPNGVWVAGFVRQGDQSFLDAVNLTDGTVTRLMPATPGRLLWSNPTQKLATWSGADLSVVAIGHGQRKVTLEGGEIQQVAWSPDGTQLAVVVGTNDASRSSLVLVDVATLKVQPVADQAVHPFWAPGGEGLFYARVDPKTVHATELIHREPNGKESVLVSKEALLQADPEVATIKGADPHVMSIQEDRDGAILFTLKYYSNVNPRFAVGSVGISAPLHLYVLPVHPDHPQNKNQIPPRPCYPGWLRSTAADLLVGVQGFGCEGMVLRMERGSWKPLMSFLGGAGVQLISPDGDYQLTQSAPHTMPTVTGVPGGGTRVVPLYGEPVHWDRG
jgi:hypothetical protein